MSEGADCAADLSDRHRIAGLRQPLSISTHLVEPKGKGQTERCRFGMNTMRPSNLRCVLEFKGAPL